MLKLSVCCCTYNRSRLLGELIQSYLMQTYPKQYRELIILDDAGQYGNLSGDGWQVVSFPRRFASLGEKRNACVSLTSPDFTHIVIADDDDIYLPWWLECHADNFEKRHEWSFASRVYWSVDNRITGKWVYINDSYLVQPAHAFSKELFWRFGGYPRMAGWEDYHLFQRFLEHGICHEDALDEHRWPYLIYRRFSKERHMTCVNLDQYQTMFTPVLPKARLEVGWHRDYLKDVERHERTMVAR